MRWRGPSSLLSLCCYALMPVCLAAHVLRLLLLLPVVAAAPTHEGGAEVSEEQVVWEDEEDGGGMPRVPVGMSELSLAPRNHLSSDEYRVRYQKHVHRLPRRPTAWDMACYTPKAMSMFFVRLCDAFGFKVRAHAWDFAPSSVQRSSRLLMLGGLPDACRWVC